MNWQNSSVFREFWPSRSNTGFGLELPRRSSDAGAELEWEHFRRAWSVRIGLDSQDVTACREAGGLGITMHVAVCAYSKTGQGGDGLLNASLLLANECHAVAGKILSR